MESNRLGFENHFLFPHLFGLKDMMYTECLEWILPYGKYSVEVICYYYCCCPFCDDDDIDLVRLDLPSPNICL